MKKKTDKLIRFYAILIILAGIEAVSIGTVATLLKFTYPQRFFVCGLILILYFSFAFYKRFEKFVWEHIR